jgi:tetratricopeptide (TPR) repeat protein
LLDAAWPTIAAALPRFLAGPNDLLQTVCNALEVFLDFTGRWDESLALSRDAEAKAVAATDFTNGGWRAYQAGRVRHLRGQMGEVHACADRSAAYWREARAGAREQAAPIQLRGYVHNAAKEYPAAIAAFREALELLRTLSPESRDVLTVLSSLAGTEIRSGDLASAERDYREALRIATAINSRECVAVCTGNLAFLALARNDWSSAEAFARQALRLCEDVHRQDSIARNHNRLARALVRQGRKDEALPHARAAVDIFTALRSPELDGVRQTLAECEE